MPTATASYYVGIQPYRRTAEDRFLGWLTWVLMGYALLGRGFAYWGVPPIFVGEITLVAGALVLFKSRTLGPVFSLTQARMMLAVMAWGLVCTLPHLGTYGIAALRDAVLYGYAVFAFVVAGLIMQQPARLRFMLLRYQRFALWFCLLGGAVYLYYKLYAPNLPRISPTVPIVSVKGGDLMVHFAGVCAFALIGMVRLRMWQAIALGGSAAIVMIGNRGGMVSFALAMAFVVWARPPRLRVTKLIYGATFAAVLLLLVNPKIQIYPGERPISVDQLVTNVTSVLGTTNNTSLEGTKEWRLTWWKKIVGYTFGGEHFMTGKGFGINLANVDGFQVEEGDALRSPHNSHMTMLARAGVPGFLLWFAMQAVWLGYMMRAFFQTKRRGDTHWHGIFTFIIAYWMAASLNACFDVYLEGPMGGIWYWCLLGIGMAAVWVYQRYPETAY